MPSSALAQGWSEWVAGLRYANKHLGLLCPQGERGARQLGCLQGSCESAEPWNAALDGKTKQSQADLIRKKHKLKNEN